MRTTLFATVVAVLSMSLVGCPATPEPETPPAPNPPVTETPDAGTSGTKGNSPEEKALFRLYDTYCEILAECQVVTSTEACQKMMEPLITLTVAGAQSAIDADRIQIGAAAEECRIFLSTLTCDATIPTGGVCERLIDGTVPADGDCFSDTECQKGLRCEATSRCPGTCVARGAVGDTVSGWNDCLEGLYQRSDGVCEAYVARDGSCAIEGARGRPSCAADSYCNETTDKCEARKSIGGDCIGDGQCTEFYRCLEGKCSVMLAPGETCTSSSDCKLDLSCYEGTGEGRCRAKAGEGGSCFAWDDCYGGLACVGLSSGAGVCQRPGGPEGTRCESDGQCADNLICYITTGTVGTCQTPHELGQRCVNSDNCRPELYCAPGASGTICTARLPQGAECMTDESCLTGQFCRFDSDVSKSFCAPVKKTGDACTSADRCLDGYCNVGINECVYTGTCSAP